ncbi:MULTISPECIES: adenylate/guanylate cyclase domain-containing protein [unclassified Mucilaginibacter]|uniref:adenylate/guanylate cyclase domain-containing protein n=1 Tax=unclassified Mucilaginibacter TaxID=2617802 RepID=UPI002AC916B9|nr:MULTISPECIES: adenylate/guanylate cyclase domain-containing protein [unclassified Mucilaginibacter]MEB0249014.1 adenylate/guanylate cyclase domain-containing protein [Mucilaginibacter sp. 5B2]MEB0279542.1 adenylate/guanylate cyclase domain-containing protein [Mucilaginibacter sp. 10B2]MEB0302287.1 adenylate/guanylate cyclase domain-containing protein [Mucilaginibacter sp. 5C4]WPX22590.1 adenylate/guanylate cyclase domain-containing protein [Mucilaginibacter sp. 5C4]
MAKILVVDDEADLEVLVKQKFRRKIRENEYEFIFAANGEEALVRIKEHPDLDIILSDINMPVMDGLTLLTHLPDANPMLKAVVVSAYGDMQNIRTAMNRGAYDFVMKPVDFEDLDLTMQRTIAYVRQLQATFKAIKENNILKMYVDENVLNFMAHKEFEGSLMKNELLEATVMFVDVCGFTAITEHIPANTVVNLLNGLFDKIVKEIIAQGGHVDKFMGDAIMAVFRGEFHLDRAIDAALSVKSHLADEPEIDAGNGKIFKPNISVGINSGEMVSGNIGSASLKRLDYTVIGDSVNLAQRLQGIATAGQIIITEDVYHKAKESFQCKVNGEFALKNKIKPVNTYEVVE